MTTITAERTVTITRVLDAPRELVFRLWTEPKHMAAWWGPRGFDNPVCELDVREGGAIRIDMRGPDGTVSDDRDLPRDHAAPAARLRGGRRGPRR